MNTMNEIETFKKEISTMEEKKKTFEHALIRMQTQYDTAVNTLRDKFGIAPDKLDDLIKEKEAKFETIKQTVSKNISAMKEYLEKIGKIINGI